MACRLALLLAMDVSRSVDEADYRVQQLGLLDALRDPAIRRALLDTPDPVALAIFEWSGRNHHDVLVDWRLIRTPQDLAAVEAAVAGRILPAVRLNTALGAALQFAHDMMARAPDCDEMVVDLSGDGSNNSGITPAQAYAQSGWGAIRVNGLAIGEHEPFTEGYYRREVMRGPGAFVEVAPKQKDFPRAIRRKLLRELSTVIIGLEPGGDRPG